MREQVGAHRHRGEDRGIGERGAVVAEDAAGNDRANGEKNVGVHGDRHGDGNGHHDGEGAPAGTGAERHDRAHDEDHRRAERAADAVAKKARKELARAHALDDLTDGEGEDEQDNETHHAAHALHHAVAEFLGGHDALLGVHDAHNDQGDGNGIENGGRTVALSQLAVAGDEQTREGAADENDKWKDHVPLVFLALGNKLVKALGIVQQRGHAIVIQLAGRLHAQLGLLHRAPVLVAQDIEQDEQQGKDAVELEGQAVEQQRHGIALDVAGGDLGGDQAHEHGAPRVQGDDAVDRRGGGIADVGELLAGDLELISQRARDNAGEHDAQQAVDKDDDADDIGDQHCNALTLDHLALLGQIVDEALNAAGDANQNDERAHQCGEQEGLQVARVSADIEDNIEPLVDRGEGIPAVDDQLADKNTDQHSQGYLSGSDRDSKGHDRRHQSQKSVLHKCHFLFYF